MRGYLAVLTAILLFTCSCGTKRIEPVGFRVMLMPPCKIGRLHRLGTDFMGNSVVLELHSFRRPTINGDGFKGRPWVGVVKEVFSTRANKTLLIAPGPDLEMEQVLTTLDQLNTFNIVDRCILMTPKQGRDISDDSCVME